MLFLANSDRWSHSNITSLLCLRVNGLRIFVLHVGVNLADLGIVAWIVLDDMELGVLLKRVFEERLLIVIT